VAIALAAIGVYGVMAYAVALRTREIGIRVALGAQRSDVLSLVLRQSTILTAVGIVLGIAGAAILTQSMRGMLFGLTPLDPATIGAVAVIFVAVATCAAFLPAWRASHVEPLRALRVE
jgi:ABC-type antimicrobial peptide transport system permease subunit